jgi:hypothetical protein
VLACQVALDMDCQEFCARFGWSAEKFRKVAQRARARLRALVADYEAGERCKGLADDLAAYVAHVAQAEQSERVRRHLTNCPACAHTARELDRVARGVGALLPLPPTVDPDVVHRLGLVGRVLGRALPFWDAGESAAAAKAGAVGAAAAAGGGGAVTAGSSVLGLGAAKLAVTAVCVAAATGGYVVCDQIGLFSGPLPRERHHIATTTAEHRAPARAASSGAARSPAPITRTITRPAATGAERASASTTASSKRSTSSSGQASGEFGFEGSGAAAGSRPRAPSAPRGSARAASADSATSGADASPSKPSSGSPHNTSTEFGFE